MIEFILFSVNLDNKKSNIPVLKTIENKDFFKYFILNCTFKKRLTKSLVDYIISNHYHHIWNETEDSIVFSLTYAIGDDRFVLRLYRLLNINVIDSSIIEECYRYRIE